MWNDQLSNIEQILCNILRGYMYRSSLHTLSNLHSLENSHPKVEEDDAVHSGTGTFFYVFLK